MVLIKKRDAVRWMLLIDERPSSIIAGILLLLLGAGFSVVVFWAVKLVSEYFFGQENKKGE